MSSGDLTNDTAQECNGFRYGNWREAQVAAEGISLCKRFWDDYATME